MHYASKSLNSAATGTAKAMESGSVQTVCVANNCLCDSVGALSGQDLCLEHFLLKCYERLDWVESLARTRRFETEAAVRAHALLRECANQTLVVSLAQRSLSNLERSRLLEIMLQCGDLQLQLRHPRAAST